MNTCSLNATGVLILDKVTPVIRALFGELDLMEDTPRPGHAWFGRLHEGCGAPWMDIHPGLVELAEQLGLPFSADTHPSTRALLEMLAQHFGAADDPDMRLYLERHDFENTADLHVLFAIAIRFDDGHGLQAISEEGAWSRQERSVPAFGGEAVYISREVVLTEASASTIDLGDSLRLALARDDLHQAHQLLHRRIERLLLSIRNRTARQALVQKLRCALTPLGEVQTEASEIGRS